ncbi:MAG TPA: hypothetical protein DDZ80_31970 [Cyanobacteria bacterium UBA8803]|nr:hypothetical protein [Cyanobacteria bacterium UBA9273]HBL62826.1 hypothetical protein [Cyanobacteria bacterium UBA8803]
MSQCCLVNSTTVVTARVPPHTPTLPPLPVYHHAIEVLPTFRSLFQPKTIRSLGKDIIMGLAVTDRVRGQRSHYPRGCGSRVLKSQSSSMNSQVLPQKFKIFIHVGCAKAASTTLQKHLFDKHSEINNLGTYPTGNLGKDSSEINWDCIYLRDEKLKKFYYNLVALDGLEYRSSGNLELYQESIKPYLKAEQINLFSSERFTSVLFSYNDIKSKAERLKEIFPEARIIIVLRNQLNMIISQYRDHPFDPRCVKVGQPVSIDNWIQIALDDNLTKYFSSLDYYQILSLYSELFGKKNVGVFLFEELVYKPDYFAEQLSDFLGINPETTKSVLLNKHENASVSHRYNIYRMLVRRRLFPNLNSLKLLPKSVRNNLLNYLKEGQKKDYQISMAMQEKVSDRLAASNNKLQQEYGLNLSSYNYPL